MAKKPHAGKTKTRLIPALSPQEAVELYEAMLMDTIALVAGLHWVDLAVAVTPADSLDYFHSIAPERTLLLPVDGNNIGECLALVIDSLLAMGYRKALALNSDGPSLPPEYLQQAASCLDDSDIVLGPSRDGGYYLVGMASLHTGIFEEVDWSTDRVLSQTLERAGMMGLSTALTPQWYDIDTPADLVHFASELQQLPEARLSHCRRLLTADRLSSSLFGSSPREQP